jgi:serine/threonine protein kinase/WD40 repeat protein
MNDDEILAAFLQEFEGAANDEARDAVVGRWAADHPRLADDLGEIAAMRQLVRPVHLPDFRIRRLLGRGGMGMVYLAWQVSLGRWVALKVCNGDVSPVYHARFLNEQHFLAQLHQTHIVPIHLAGQHREWKYFAMAYIDGAALSNVVSFAHQQEASRSAGQTPPLKDLVNPLLRRRQAAIRTALTCGAPSTTVLDVPDPPPASTRRLTLSGEYFRSAAGAIAEAAEALQYAHNLGVIHRDVKPGNLLVDRNGQCWVIDFGLARRVAEVGVKGAAEPGPGEAVGTLTQGLVGTPQYMAPEQYLRPEQPNPHWDVWALGVTLYELLRLRQAFAGPNRLEIERRVTTAEPIAVERLANVPADLAAICRQAMKKKPEERYPTAQALAEDLRRWLRGMPTMARPARTARRMWLWARRNPAWATALVLGMVLFLSLALGSIARTQAQKRAAEERAAVAEEGERNTRREAKMQLLLRLRLTPHSGGWADTGWALVREIADIRPGEDVRNQAAALLGGLDARKTKRFECSGSAAAFDSQGQRLLVGGLDKEGAWLWDSATDSRQTSSQVGEGPVAFGRGGAALQLMAPKDKEVSLVLWDVARQQEVQRIAVAGADPEFAPPMALANDASLLAAATHTADGKGQVGVWEAATGHLLHRFAAMTQSLAFAPGGSLLAAGGEDGHITVWDLATGEPVAQIASEQPAIECLALCRDRLRRTAGGTSDWLLAAGDQGGSVIIWNLRTKLPRAFCRGSHHAVNAVAFSPDGLTLASAGRADVKLWDVTTGRLLLSTGITNVLTGVAFAPDGKRLAVSSMPAFGDPGPTVVLDLDDCRGVQTLRGLLGQVTLVRFSTDGRRVAALSQDWRLGVWDTDTGQLLHVFQTPPGAIADNADFAFHPNGRQLAFATWQSARLWDLASGKTLRSWVLPPGFVDQLAFRPDGKLLSFRVETRDGRAAPSRKHPGVCRIRDLLAADPHKPLAEKADFSRKVFCAAAAPDGSYFMAEGLGGPEGKDSSIKVFDGLTGTVLWSEPARLETGGLRLDPTGRLVMHSLDLDKAEVHLTAVPSGRSAGSLQHGAHLLGPEARLLGRLNAIGSGLGLFRPDDAVPLVTLNVDTVASSIPLSCFNQAGTHVAWGNRDGTVNIADIAEVQRRLASVGLGW